MLCYCYIVLCYVMLFQILAKNQEQCYIRRPSLMATTVATSSAKTMAVAMAVAICTATGWKKPMKARVMATLVAKNAGKYMAGVKPRAANSIAKFRLRAKALGTTRGKEKGKLVLRANAKATKLAKLWPKLWQGPKTGRVRVSAKSLGKADQEGTLHGPMILYAAVGLHKRLLTLFYMKRK